MGFIPPMFNFIAGLIPTTLPGNSYRLDKCSQLMLSSFLDLTKRKVVAHVCDLKKQIQKKQDGYT